MAGIQASMAVNTGMTVDIQQVDKGYLAQSNHCRYTLGIHLPFLVGALHWLGFST
jgi:hypothetical protein